jgi:hypothetical protein
MKLSKQTVSVICLFIFNVIAAYDPNKFYIGAWSGPVLTGTQATDEALYQAIQNDNYNLIFIDLDLPSLQPNVGSPGNPNLFASNVYRLSRLANITVGPLQTMITDADGLGNAVGHFNNPYFPPNRTDTSVATWITDHYSAAAIPTLQDRMIGYVLADEPHDSAGQCTNIITQIGRINSDHPGMIGYANLNPCDTSKITPTAYLNYIHQFAVNSNVKVISFDIYPIMDNSKTPSRTSGYWTPRLKYFWNYEQMISQTQSQSRNDLKYWAIIEGTRPDPNYKYKPNKLCATFCLNTALIYGAKGIIWYNWYNWSCRPQNFPPNSSDTSIPYHIAYSPMRDSIRALNGELGKMSTILTRLTWIKTVHGTAKDPQSGETGLTTPEQETTVLKMGGSGQAALDSNLAIGIFKKGSERYLMVFNKDLTSHRDQVIALNGTQYNPMNFNKTTGNWENWPPAEIDKIITNTTRFAVHLDKAEMKLIRLNTDISPAINLLLGD